MPQPASPQTDLPDRPFGYVNGCLAIDRVPCLSIAEQYGTPLYVESAVHIRHRLRLFQKAFAAVANTVCFAVKANSALAIVQLLGECGAGFDIVSGGELERVRRASPKSLTSVVFSGVGKQAWEIDAALASGICLFNVESPGEMDLLAARASAIGRVAPLAFRVNPDVRADTHPYISTGLQEHKFGVPISEARELYRRAAIFSSLRPAGVSVHIGSQIRSVAPFAEAMARVAALTRDLRADRHDITYVDAGGGLGVDYEAPLVSPAASDAGPAKLVEQYAAALVPVVRELNCHLLLEPGRFLVAQAGGLLCRVVGLKQNGAKRFVITDAAMNDLIRPALYQAHHEILPAIESQGERQPVDVVGPVCESGDFFAHDRRLSPVGAGDLMLLLDTGAYGMSQSSNYNTRPRPAEVLVDESAVHLIRRRETLDDLLGPEFLLPQG